MRGITLFSLLNLALKHIVALILSAVIFATAAFSYCEYVATPRYSATGSVLVTNGVIKVGTDINENGESVKLENTDIVASLNFMATAIDMLKQNEIYKLLAEKINNKYTYNQLVGMSKIERRNDNSLYIDITFTAPSKDEAVKLVNEYMELTPNYIKNHVDSIAVSFNPVDYASKIYPRTITTTFLFAVLGAAIVFSILILIFLMNSTITDEDEFKERFDIQVIGSIPDFASARSRKSYKYYNRYSGYYGRGNNKDGN